MTQAFAIGRAYYKETLNLEVLSCGYPVALNDEAVVQLEGGVAPFSQVLADKVKDVVLPQRG